MTAARTRSRAVLVAALLVAGATLGGCVDATPERANPRHRVHPSHSTRPPHTPGTGQGGGTSEARGVRALARGPVSAGWQVSSVVDGDTIHVQRGGRDLTIRLIGIDTPETVHPTEPVECYGPEASTFATHRLLGEPVALELDPSQGRRDYYGRTLAYVWTVRGRDALFNLDAVRRGYALEYTYDDPYAWRPELLRAQQHAREQGLGVWRCPRPGD